MKREPEDHRDLLATKAQKEVLGLKVLTAGQDLVVNKENREIQEQKVDLAQMALQDPKASEGQPDLVAARESLVKTACEDQLANRANKVQMVHKVPLVLKEKLDLKDLLDRPEDAVPLERLEKEATSALLVSEAVMDPQEEMESKDQEDPQDRLDQKDLLETQDHKDVKDLEGPRVQMVFQGKLVMSGHQV